MSSLMDKRKLPGLEQSRASKMFLRSNSFQKLCSLAHPMRLKGFKSNKEALKSVFESLIVTTRGVLQSVTYRILCFLFLTPFSKLVSEPLATVSQDGRFKTVRLFLKLTLSMIISTDKSECDNGRFDCPKEDEPAERLVADCVDTGVQTDDPSEFAEIEEPTVEDQFFDCKEEFHGTSSTKPSTEELKNRLLNKTSIPSLDTTKKSSRSSQQLSHRLIVYTCILGCIIHVSALTYLLNVATSIPPGLVFLLSSICYIGYVLMRIVLNQCSSPKRRRTVHAKGSKASKTSTTTPVALVKPSRKKPTTTAKGIHPILDAVSKQVASLLQSKKMMLVVPAGGGNNGSRLSRCDMAPRSRSRPSMLSAEDKTISKIKLF